MRRSHLSWDLNDKREATRGRVGIEESSAKAFHGVWGVFREEEASVVGERAVEGGEPDRQAW